jgi:cell division protein ZipA
MNLTTQLRIILLLVGAAIWLGIYLMGRRRVTPHISVDADDHDDPLAQDATAEFAPLDELDEEELETPAYMRRQGQREMRQDYEPRIANPHDYDGVEEVRDDGQHFVDVAVHSPRYEGAVEHADAHAPYSDTTTHTAVTPAEEAIFAVRHEPRVSLDDSFEVSATSEPHLSATSLGDFNAPESAHVAMPTQKTAEPERVASPVIPVMAEPVTTHYQLPVRPNEHRDAPVPTPTLSDIVRKPAPPVSPAPPATGKSSDNAAARRKIIALRLPMPERVPGAQLLSLLQREQLQHGKFNIFHRLHESSSVFSVASMVEPGTFDPHTMAEQQFPGVTLFMLLPGPLDGLVAYDQMMSCAQRLAHSTGGLLQDERGSKLTTQSMDRLRDEVLDFQHLIGGMATAH